MKIAIYGSGAMGTVFGAYLTQNGQAVTMIDNYKEHIDELNRNGAKIVGVDNFTVPVKAILPEEMEGTYDIVYLFTKQTANNIVLPHLRNYLNEQSVVCTLQNGVPEFSVDEMIGGNRTVGGTVLWGATFVKPGVSEVTQDIHIGNTLFDIGEINGEITDRIKNVAKVLEVMGPVEIMDNLIEARWSKILLNSCMSGLSAITGETFGTILQNERASKCLSFLAKEIVDVADLINQKLAPVNGVDTREYGLVDSEKDFARSQKHFEDFYDDKRTAIASMLQDLQKNKKTEVEMINGFVVQIGEEHAIKTPLNKKIVQIVNEIENGDRKYSMENIQELMTIIEEKIPFN